jgi:hypothetical protein
MTRPRQRSKVTAITVRDRQRHRHLDHLGEIITAVGIGSISSARSASYQLRAGDSA